MVHIVVDAGGTYLRIACKDGDTQLDCIRVPIDPDGYPGTLSMLVSNIDDLLIGRPCEGIGISIAGSTDGERILSAGNLRAFMGRPLAADLRLAFDCPVLMFNDGQAMGASEYSVQGKPLILAIWGSGVNFAIVQGDDIFFPQGLGPSIIGEGGHQRIVEDGWLCGCGQLGCLEAYVGGSRIKYHYEKPAEMLSEEQWDVVLSRMAQGLHNVIALTGGSLPIYFAGGIACGQAGRLPVLREKLEKSGIQCIVPELPPIACCTYGDDAGLHGASLIVQRHLAGP